MYLHLPGVTKKAPQLDQYMLSLLEKEFGTIVKVKATTRKYCYQITTQATTKHVVYVGPEFPTYLIFVKLANANPYYYDQSIKPSYGFRLPSLHWPDYLVFAGKSCAGKNYVADMLLETFGNKSYSRGLFEIPFPKKEDGHVPIVIQNNFLVESFAKPLKTFFESSLDCNWNIDKDDTGCGLYGKTPRELSIILADLLKKEVSNNFFVDTITRRLNGHKAIITDLRFKTELDGLMDHCRTNGKTMFTVRVTSPKQKMLDIPSETELDSYLNWDFIFRNNPDDLDATDDELKRLLNTIFRVDSLPACLKTKY